MQQPVSLLCISILTNYLYQQLAVNDAACWPHQFNIINGILGVMGSCSCKNYRTSNIQDLLVVYNARHLYHFNTFNYINPRTFTINFRHFVMVLGYYPCKILQHRYMQLRQGLQLGVSQYYIYKCVFPSTFFCSLTQYLYNIAFV